MRPKRTRGATLKRRRAHASSRTPAISAAQSPPSVPVNSQPTSFGALMRMVRMVDGGAQGIARA
jgi:hypothetical protein